MVKDPVCGMEVDEKASKYRSEHEGITFYFYSPECVETSYVDPHRYGHPEQ